MSAGPNDEPTGSRPRSIAAVRRLIRDNQLPLLAVLIGVAAADGGIDRALRLMHASGEEHIAVVETRESMRLVGFPHQVDMMLTYNRALMAARREEPGEA